MAIEIYKSVIFVFFEYVNVDFDRHSVWKDWKEEEQIRQKLWRLVVSRFSCVSNEKSNGKLFLTQKIVIAAIKKWICFLIQLLLKK